MSKEIQWDKGIPIRRFATEGGRYYGPIDLDTFHQFEKPLKPSWTNLASVESSPGLAQWKQQHGYWADIITCWATTKGTGAHNPVEDMINGKEVTEDDILQALEAQEDIKWKLMGSKWMMLEEIKKCLVQFILWFEEHNPTILKSEIMLWHPDVPYAGTADMIMKIHNKKQNQDILMVGDLKTGNESDKHFVQCMAYAILLEKIYNVKVGAVGSLYCQGRYRGEAKPGKMKVKIIRNKAGGFTEDAHKLMNKVVKLVELFEANNPNQPKQKKRLPKKFSLNINKGK